MVYSYVFTESLMQERTVPVIAYHPDVDLRMTQEEYIDKVLHTLAVVAVLTGYPANLLVSILLWSLTTVCTCRAYLLGVGTEQSFPIQHDPSRYHTQFVFFIPLFKRAVGLKSPVLQAAGGISERPMR